MSRRTNNLESLRRALYFGQRTIGDAQAARRGPGPLARRYARRVVRRTIFRRLPRF
jgi:hypothetical protein